MTTIVFDYIRTNQNYRIYTFGRGTWQQVDNILLISFLNRNQPYLYCSSLFGHKLAIHYNKLTFVLVCDMDSGKQNSYRKRREGGIDGEGCACVSRWVAGYSCSLATEIDGQGISCFRSQFCPTLAQC